MLPVLFRYLIAIKMVQSTRLGVHLHLEVRKNSVAVALALFVAVPLEAHTQQTVVEEADVAVVVVFDSQPACFGVWT